MPDVAGDADENSGYTILVDGQEVSNVGGTSAVAPLWAALLARINQQLGKPVGYINPLLYSKLGKSGAFHDITVGNNDPTGGQIGGYQAGPGWDACTGGGSPDGSKLLAQLQAAGVSAGGSAPASPGSTGSTGDGGGASPLPVGSVSTQTGGNALLWSIIILIVLIVVVTIGALIANHGF